LVCEVDGFQQAILVIQPVGIHIPHIPIEDYNKNLWESIYLKYQLMITRIACWNPSTSNTNKGLQE
jgi:hypothetical protein